MDKRSLGRERKNYYEHNYYSRCEVGRCKETGEIYGYYVEHTVITFEYETPSVEEFQERMRHIMERYPYLVIKVDGKVEGYAYAGAFVGRAAYDWSCELTIYLDHNREKCGLGRKLYEALEASLKKMGILNLYACIGYPQVEDEYLTKTVRSSMLILVLRRWEPFRSADINLNVGMI